MSFFTQVGLAGRSLVRKYFPRNSTDLDYDPYDQKALEDRGNKLLKAMQGEPKREPMEACQRLLEIMEESYPTAELSAEYFANLEITLRDKPRLERPGQLVIGLGTGRSGSTSLAAMLETVPNSCSTHETPPQVFWNPLPEQVDFHVKRFKALADHYALVCDVSHWWLNAIDQLFDHFPTAKAVGLFRDRDECAHSFMLIQGSGKGTFNPWAPRGNVIWTRGKWDASYPSYPLPSYANRNPDRAKLELITQYVETYNAQLETLRAKTPDRIKLVRTEDLSLDSVQEEIFQIAKGRGQTSDWKLNVKSTADGKKNQIKV